jgi:hypothetical protein
MSKERELLKKILNTGWLNHELSCEVEAILAQPEHIVDVTDKVEPVAWKVVDRTTGDFMFSRVKPMGRSYKYDVVIPLYTAPAARKHLTGIEISQGFKADDDATHPYSYWAGINFAEKHHDSFPELGNSIVIGGEIYIKKQEPLSEDKLDVLAEANITDEGIAGYYLGFRDAEKYHGITGERND